VKESKNLSCKKKIKNSAFALTFFEESAEKVIRACNSLAFFKKNSKKDLMKDVSGESLEVLSEKLSPDFFVSQKNKKEQLIKFENPTLKGFKESYKTAKIYSSKKNSYQNFSLNVNKNKNIEKFPYQGVISYGEENSFEEEIKIIFVNEVSTFKF